MNVAVALVTAMLATSQSKQFDLACSGTRTSISLSGTKTEPYARIFRFDLALGQWCDGDCKAPQNLLRVEPTRLVLRDQSADSNANGHAIRESINRETGRHSSMDMYFPVTRNMPMVDYDGLCEVRPFSGFPSFKTKF